MLYQHHPYRPAPKADARLLEIARLLAEAEETDGGAPRRRPRIHVFSIAAAVVTVVAVTLLAATTRTAAARPPANQVVQWNQIAEDTIVASGAFQNEGLIYMSYVSAAVYDAVTAINGGYEPYAATIAAAPNASADAAAVEAAYETLVHYFPGQATNLSTLRAQSLASITDGSDKAGGIDAGAAAAQAIIELRDGDGRLAPVGTTSAFPTLTPGAGVWRLAAPAFAAPQTPWVRQVRPFVLRAADQFLPGPPPPLASRRWAEAFDETKRYGSATGSARTDEQTTTARYWSANVIRQYNRLFRDVALMRGLDITQAARLAAMVNVVGADAQIAVMYAKYHYLFWRPVTAIDPTAVRFDGFGAVPGYDDGNAFTSEQLGWRPLLATPNHPEYPAAHGSITSAVAEVIRTFLGTNDIGLDLHGFDTAGPGGNLDAVRHFATPDDLRDEIVNARVWAGVHYRFSGVAGVTLGRKVAQYDLAHAFRAAK